MKTINFAAPISLIVGLNLIFTIRNLSALTQKNEGIASESAHIRKTAFTAISTKNDQYSDLFSHVHRLVNEFRSDHGLTPLTLDPLISAEAREHSADMARTRNTISHRGFEQRLQDIGKKIPYRAAAENVAVNVGYENPPRTAVEGWKNSPEHRKNMLGEFSLTGIGIARSKDGRYFFTQIFLEPIK